MVATEGPYRILVVDDEPDLEPLVLQRMRRAIRSGRYEFVFAQNGVEALQALGDDEDIDMVLSDINMPQMDGLALLSHMPEVAPDVQAVIISAYGDMKNIRAAMNLGAFDFVTKPVDFEDLRITIERALNNLEAWREATSSRARLIALQNELDVAGKMQQAILPTEFLNKPGYEMYGSMMPARDVGGDFFDVLYLSNGCIGLAIADVSDKGVPAALFMMASRTLLKASALSLKPPGQALREVNDLLYDDNDAMMFVTLFYAVYDPTTGELTYANGGHNEPLIVRPDGNSSILPGTSGIALGVVPEMAYQEKTISIAPGDAIVFYTDGVTEAVNTSEEEFGLPRLQQVFASNPPTDVKAATQAVFSAVNDFAGTAPQFDDITCLVFRRIGSGP
ncbi:MAG: SpoIIE family protein phosphatase [Dehalococcoidia bacterium]|nr:SpoIIE family protein phosphatase [Dehalococcoidia bacterium]